MDGTKARQEIATTLQNSLIVRKQVNNHQRADSQVKGAAIDSINYEKVQYVLCFTSERPGVNIVMAF